jgi:hypothetical protein
VSELRRYWGACLIVAMIGVHACVIGYVRSRIARLSTFTSTVVEIGEFRFQPVHNPTMVYHFRLHAVVEPAKFVRGRERLQLKRMEIVESSEQMLRQVDTNLLDDPTQTEIRDRLLQVTLQHLDEPIVSRLLITDWLQLPVNALDWNGSSQLVRN